MVIDEHNVENVQIKPVRQDDEYVMLHAFQPL